MAHVVRAMRVLGWLCGLGLAFASSPALASPPDDGGPVDPSEDSAPAESDDSAPAEPETDAPESETDAPEPETDAPEPETDAPEPETDAPEPESPAETPTTDTSTADAEVASEVEAPPPELEGADLEAADLEDTHEAAGPHQPNPKIPPTGKAQLWYRSTTFFDYFGNNYNTRTNDDRFFALVNFVNFGVDTRLSKKWQLSAYARVDTHNVFNAKKQAMCDIDNEPILDDEGEPILDADGDLMYEVTPEEQAVCNRGNDYRIERVQIRASHKYVELNAGDFNVNFGRGIPLSVRKIADIGVDATVKGGRVDLRLDKLEVTALGGVMNRQQTDFATRALYPDPGYLAAPSDHALCGNLPQLRQNKFGNPFLTMCSDIVAGGRVEGKLPGKVRLGAHYVNFWFGELLQKQPEGLQLAGGDISRKRIAKHWDLFVGVTGLFRNLHHRPKFGGQHEGLAENGVAAYLSNSLTFGRTFVLVEGKYYDNFVVAKDTNPTTIQYTEAPTLERADQIIPAASNTAGGRLLLEHTLEKSRVTLIANYLGYAFAIANDIPMFDPIEGEMAHHAYGGLRWRNLDKGSEIQAFAGYRYEGHSRRSANYPRAYVRRLPHAEFYVNQVVGKTRGMSHSLSLRVEWRYEETNKASVKRFHRGNIIFGYGLSPWLTVALIGGYSSEFPPLLDEPKLHDQPCPEGADAECVRKPHLWPGAEVRFNFFEASFLRIFAGRQVGGLLCVNGSCRQLPDFEGVRMDLVLSF